MEKILIKIGKKIRSLIKEKGISEQQFARKMKLDGGSLSRYLNGKQNITIKQIVRFEKELKAEITH